MNTCPIGLMNTDVIIALGVHVGIRVNPFAGSIGLETIQGLDNGLTAGESHLRATTVDDNAVDTVVKGSGTYGSDNLVDTLSAVILATDDAYGVDAAGAVGNLSDKCDFKVTMTINIHSLAVAERCDACGRDHKEKTEECEKKRKPYAGKSAEE